MNYVESDLRSTGFDGGRPGGEPQGLRAAMVTADDNLRGIVFQAIQDGALPVRIELEIVASAEMLDSEHLTRLRSSDPDIVVLDMSTDPDRAIRTAATIAASSPRAALVGVGPELEASFLLDAMRAGLVEYVPRPAEPASVREALSRVMRKKGWAEAPEAHGNGKILSFFSAKGGSGSTSVVTNVGIELHRLTGRKTLLVDLDLELGEIASLLGVRPRFHFVDLVRNFHRMDGDLLPSYIESHESGVHVLSAPFEPEIGEQVTGEHITRILGFLRSHYDYVLVDTSKSLAPQSLAALQSADEIYLITNMDVPSLRNLKRCLPTLDRVTGGDVERLRLVVNRYNPKSLVRREDLEETLGIDVHWTLVNDFQTVIESISTGQPLVLNGNSRYAEELKGLARTIVDGGAASSEAKRSLVGRLLSPFRSSSPRPTAPMSASPMEVSSHG